MGSGCEKELFSMGFNWSTFFQGISSKVNYTIIPIFTLFFIKTPVGFGNFFGYLALVAALASLINGYISDKMKSRKHFSIYSAQLAVISFLPLAFAENPYSWAIFVA